MVSGRDPTFTASNTTDSRRAIMPPAPRPPLIHDTPSASSGPAPARDEHTAPADSSSSPSSPPPAPDGEPRPGALIGRYVVLYRLGAGGMGVVLAAYDPELDRKVALKLLRPRAHAGHDTSRAALRLQREAMALARLGHHHIVAVHDAGVHRDRVFVAMEFVEGETLGAWLRARPRTWRDVVRVFEQAGRGLEHAHAKGLIHRDFKPDNVMIDVTGRVRVMDFGLVRSEHDEPTSEAGDDPPRGDALAVPLTQCGAILGTPAYMSPEQLRGEAVTALSDQFSFCVALHEALHRVRPFPAGSLEQRLLAASTGAILPPPRDPRVPAWLRAIVLRGLAADPQARHPGMTQLLAALASGDARKRRATIVVGAAALALIGAGAVAYQRVDVARRTAACTATGDEIDEVWNDAARAAVRAGVVATGWSDAPSTADRVMPFLDRQAETWREHRTRACVMADLEATLDAELLDRAEWCLDERRMELAALVTELADADKTSVQKAVPAAASLSLISTCTEGQALAAMLSPPQGEARARAVAVHRTLSQAGSLRRMGKYTDGLQQARAALEAAEALGWPPLIAAARQQEGSLLGATGDDWKAEGTNRTAYMEAAKARAWDVAARAALDLMAVGYRQYRPAEAKVWAEHAEVALSFTGDRLGLGEATRLSRLGGVHIAAGEYAEAKALFERVLTIRERALGPEHLDVADALSGLAAAHKAMGFNAEAKPLHERALAIRTHLLGPEHPTVAMSLGNLALTNDALGEHITAKRLHEQALLIMEKSLGADHPAVAHAYDNLGYNALEQDLPAAALPFLERAVAILDKYEGVQNDEIDSRFNLARALVLTGGDRQRALAEARKAADGCSVNGDCKAKRLDVEIAAFIVEHDVPP